MVLQEPFLFSRTIAENIGIVSEELDMETVRAAAAAAALDETITSFAAGYNTMVGERGVTLSGGECLWQPDFSAALLQACKERGISTAIETTGYADMDVIRRILAHTDTVLMDIKHTDPQKHKEFTTKDNAMMLENARLIAKEAKPLFT